MKRSNFLLLILGFSFLFSNQKTEAGFTYDHFRILAGVTIMGYGVLGSYNIKKEDKTYSMGFLHGTSILFGSKLLETGASNLMNVKV